LGRYSSERACLEDWLLPREGCCWLLLLLPPRERLRFLPPRERRRLLDPDEREVCVVSDMAFVWVPGGPARRFRGNLRLL